MEVGLEEDNSSSNDNIFIKYPDSCKTTIIAVDALNDKVVGIFPGIDFFDYVQLNK